ncbi:MAG: hypothetical protein AB8B74_03490 [Crocinitomicaceae bacterium]
MDKRVRMFLSKLTILIGVIVVTSSIGFSQNEGTKQVKKKKEISAKKQARQIAKVNKKKRKHVYKIQDKPTRKRMRKAYKSAMRRQKGKRSRGNRLV